jgi:hypothetical protein
MSKVKKYLEKLGIEVREDNTIPSALSFFDDERKKFVLRYNPNYSQETTDFLLLHEFMHIYREDILRNDVIVEVYNVASDCIINDILSRTHQPPNEIPPITIHSLQNCCQKIYDFFSGAKPLYDHLLKEHTQIHIVSCFQTTQNPSAISEIQKIKKQILDDIKQSIKEEAESQQQQQQQDQSQQNKIPKEIRDAVKQEIQRKSEEKKENNKNAGSGHSEFSIIPVKPSESTFLKQIINKFLKQFRENESFSMFRVKYERLYRNSRIPNIPRDIPILQPVPITFFVDVSGSMDRYINAILNTIAHYEKEMPVQKIFFSDKAIKTNKRIYYNAGGGTQIKPAIDLMSKTFLTVVFSDYEFFDMNYKQFVNTLMKKTKIAILFDEELKVKEVIKK